MAAALAAFAAGLLFALGLGLGGMTQPARVIGFLDVAGDWDPTLALVMGGALAVYAPLHQLIMRRRTPLLGARFEVPTRRDIDAALLVGAAVFGVGWGLAGFCPGPVIVSLASGRLDPLVFAAAMLLGMAGSRRAIRPLRRSGPKPDRRDG
jgi:hypothetical protein